jgi:hypothetical protein
VYFLAEMKFSIRKTDLAEERLNLTLHEQPSAEAVATG